MEWFVLALIASVLWAVTDVLDKYILTEHIRNPISYQLLLLFTEVPIPFLLLALMPISFCFPWSALSMLAGLILCSSFLLYYRAMAVEEASRVISLLYVGPIFVLPLAFMFLGESLGISQYLGVVLLVSSTVLVSYRKVKGKKSSAISPALGFMLTFDLFHAGYAILAKYILNFINNWHFLFWWLIGRLVGGFLLFCFPRFRRDFLTDFPTIAKSVFFWRSFGTCLSFIGVISYYTAVSVKSISLVAAVPSAEPFFVLLFTVLLSSIMPGILEEEVNRRAFALKMSAIVFIVLGAWLIAR